ncbi:MAG: dockerin type I repeat-containing protein [Coriobacteriia bacterium]|nr:dockerin type I repeat-containing protein [Coriobacteriia bacterium]
MKKRQVLSVLVVLALTAASYAMLPVKANADEAGYVADNPGLTDQGLGTTDEYIFQLAITTPENESSFMLPICGRGDYFDWNIDWGDNWLESASGLRREKQFITHQYSVAGDYIISIRPNGSTEAWLAAFGFTGSLYDDILLQSGANTYENLAMVTGALSPIRPEMTRTTAQISGNAVPPIYEWALTFNGCFNLKTAPLFEGWETVKKAGAYFAAGMFFASGLNTLPEGFTLPQGFVSVGPGFALQMFDNCHGLTTLPDSFNLPQGITEVWDDFAYRMFKSCDSLDALPNGFNLPQQITTVYASGFADSMFEGAGGESFQINDAFCLPQSMAANGFFAYRIFMLSNKAPLQHRTAASIIGSLPTPKGPVEAFDQHFIDIDYIPVNWGGKGLEPPIVGSSGSGDLNGDGLVTMDEVIIALQATIGVAELSTVQLAAIDMDSDGAVTMADVVLMSKITV